MTKGEYLALMKFPSEWEALARIIHEGKEEKAFDVVKSRCDTSFHYKKSLLDGRYHTTECSI